MWESLCLYAKGLMHRNLIKSLVIGSILGVLIGVSEINSSNMGLIISLFSCVVLGLVTESLSMTNLIYMLFPLFLLQVYFYVLFMALSMGLFTLLG